ncbi:hypothetical protein KFK09_001622 [Dendrobium nobile]|uniref:Transducin/WD40 repeat-like superfamily protein n=1 Tax=Dendrobium nobile TaxID=94219 RepID=A0A8T3C5C0_DENNO|nr:hypothetical protein KFK09_001622 [Dendrobium nobile]
MEWTTVQHLDLRHVGRGLKILQPHAVVFHPTQAIVAVAIGTYIIEFDVLSGSKIASLEIGARVIRMAYIPSGGHIIISVIEDCTIRSCDFDNEQTLVLHSPGKKSERISSDIDVHLAMTPLQPVVFFGFHRRMSVTVVGTIEGGKSPTKIKTDLKKPIVNLSCHPRLPVLFVAYADGLIRAYNIQTYAVHYTLQLDSTTKLLGASAFAFHPTMEWIFVGDRKGTLLAWDISTERPNMIGITQVGSHPVTSISWLPTLRLLVTISKDGALHVWSTRAPNPNAVHATFFEHAAIEAIDITQILTRQNGEAVFPLPRIKNLAVHSKLNLAALLFEDMTDVDSLRSKTAYTREGRKQLFAFLQSARGSSVAVLKEKLLALGSSGILAEHQLQTQLEEHLLKGQSQLPISDIARKALLHSHFMEGHASSGPIPRLPLITVSDANHQLRDVPVCKPFHLELNFFNKENHVLRYPVRAFYLDSFNLMAYNLSSGAENIYKKLYSTISTPIECIPVSMLYSSKQHLFIVVFELSGPAGSVHEVVLKTEVQSFYCKGTSLRGRDAAFIGPNENQYAILDEERTSLSLHKFQGLTLLEQNRNIESMEENKVASNQSPAQFLFETEVDRIFSVPLDGTILYAISGKHIALVELRQEYRLLTDNGYLISTKTDDKKPLLFSTATAVGVLGWDSRVRTILSISMPCSVLLGTLNDRLLFVNPTDINLKQKKGVEIRTCLVGLLEPLLIGFTTMQQHFEQKIDLPEILYQITSRYGQFDSAKETYEVISDFESMLDLFICHLNPSAMRWLAERLEDAATNSELRRYCERILRVRSTGWTQSSMFANFSAESMVPKGPEWGGGNWEIKTTISIKNIPQWELAGEVTPYMKTDDGGIPSIIADHIGVYLGAIKGRGNVVEVSEKSLVRTITTASSESNGSAISAVISSNNNTGKTSDTKVGSHVDSLDKPLSGAGALLAEQTKAEEEFKRSLYGQFNCCSSDADEATSKTKKINIRIRDKPVSDSAVNINKLKEATKQFKIGGAPRSKSISRGSQDISPLSLLPAPTTTTFACSSMRSPPADAFKTDISTPATQASSRVGAMGVSAEPIPEDFFENTISAIHVAASLPPPGSYLLKMDQNFHDCKNGEKIKPNQNITTGISLADGGVPPQLSQHPGIPREGLGLSDGGIPPQVILSPHLPISSQAIDLSSLEALGSNVMKFSQRSPSTPIVVPPSQVPRGVPASICFKTGLAHLEQNELPDSLSCFDEAFLTLAKDHSNGSDIKAQATICAHYKIAVAILQEIVRLQKVHGSSTISAKEEIARLSRHLASLPLLAKHRINCIRTAIKRNIDVQNFGYAKQMLDLLLVKAPPSKQDELRSLIEMCVQRGLSNKSIYPQEDPSQFCAASLSRLSTIGHDICDLCGSKFSARSSPGCIVCGMGCIKRSDAVAASPAPSPFG